MKKNELYIYALSINTEIDETIEKAYLSRLDDTQRNRMLRFHFKEDYKRSMYGELLSRHYLRNILGIPDQKLVVKRSKYGKPFLPDYPELQFNISHSGEWVVCAIGYCNVGIDIEKIQNFDMSMAKNTFTRNEYEWLQRLNSQERIRAFYQLWTLKEAYVKCQGKGMSIPFNSFEIVFTDNEVCLIIDHWDGMMQCLPFHEKYALSICSSQPKKVSPIYIVDSSDIISF